MSDHNWNPLGCFFHQGPIHDLHDISPRHQSLASCGQRWDFRSRLSTQEGSLGSRTFAVKTYRGDDTMFLCFYVSICFIDVFICLCILMFICRFIRFLSCFSTCVFSALSIYLPTYLSIYLSTYLSSYLSMYQSINSSMYLFIY